MPIFKNFKGQYFDIPDAALKKFRITAKEAQKKLSPPAAAKKGKAKAKKARVEGGQVHPMDAEVEGQSDEGMIPGDTLHQRTL
jgi:hypothetical protein